MTILVDIKPEVQEELSRQAAAHASTVSKSLAPHQLDNTLREIAQFSDKIPLLPDEAFSRESLYRDHD